MDEEKLRRLFKVGRQFERASDILGKVAVATATDNSKSLQLSSEAPAVPAVVCGAFAMELQLKCLVSLQSGNDPPRGHRLSELFDLLNEDAQLSIQKKYEQIIEGSPQWESQFATSGLSLKFYDVLSDASDAFVEWRYHHEFEKRKAWLAWPILVALLDEIVDIRPEWRDLS